MKTSFTFYSVASIFVTTNDSLEVLLASKERLETSIATHPGRAAVYGKGEYRNVLAQCNRLIRNHHKAFVK